MKTYEVLTFFVFDHPLLLKRFEPGMSIGKHLFDLLTMWIRLPGLRLELWTPKLLSRVVSPIGRPLMPNPATVNKTKVDYAKVLVQFHDPKSL